MGWFVIVPTCFNQCFIGIPIEIPGADESRYFGGSYLTFTYINHWLVVSTPLKNISQLGGLFPIYGKTQNVPNHQPDHIVSC